MELIFHGCEVINILLIRWCSFECIIGICCSKTQIGAIVGGCLGALLLIGIVIVAVLYFKRQMARSEERKARINARLAGEDEILVSYVLRTKLHLQ